MLVVGLDLVVSLMVGINKMVAVCRYRSNFTYYACCAMFFFATLRTKVVDKLGSEHC